MKEEIRRLQNHFNAGKKDGFQAKVYYSVNDRVHLKSTNVNGIITGVIFKEDRSYPYLKIKWDNVPVEPEKCKTFYDPFDVVKEIKYQHKEKKQGKEYHNFYLDIMRNKNAED